MCVCVCVVRCVAHIRLKVFASETKRDGDIRALSTAHTYTPSELLYELIVRNNIIVCNLLLWLSWTINVPVCTWSIWIVHQMWLSQTLGTSIFYDGKMFYTLAYTHIHTHSWAKKLLLLLVGEILNRQKLFDRPKWECREIKLIWEWICGHIVIVSVGASVGVGRTVAMFRISKLNRRNAICVACILPNYVCNYIVELEQWNDTCLR